MGIFSIPVQEKTYQFGERKKLRDQEICNVFRTRKHGSYLLAPWLLKTQQTSCLTLLVFADQELKGVTSALKVLTSDEAAATFKSVGGSQMDSEADVLIWWQTYDAIFEYSLRVGLRKVRMEDHDESEDYTGIMT